MRERMSFRWYPPEVRKTEEAFLFASASRTSLPKAGVEHGEASFREYVWPLLEEKSVHASLADNAIAFALLGEILQPSGRSASIPLAVWSMARKREMLTGHV